MTCILLVQCVQWGHFRWKQLFFYEIPILLYSKMSLHYHICVRISHIRFYLCEINVSSCIHSTSVVTSSIYSNLSVMSLSSDFLECIVSATVMWSKHAHIHSIQCCFRVCTSLPDNNLNSWPMSVNMFAKRQLTWLENETHLTVNRE